MKLSDYVMGFIGEKVADSVFLMSGGGIMHLVDSLGKSDLHAYCCHHEQAATIAAEGYARIKNVPGVVIVTTGPGGTNAVTGIAGAWLDSIPLLVIAGQVKRADITPRGEDGFPTVRQIGFQELNVIDIVKPITKYAVTVEDPKDIRYHLEKAVYLATHGRPGPVFVEIPLDVQAAEIDPEPSHRFDRLREFPIEVDFAALPHVTQNVAELLNAAKRPLLMAGNGIRLAGGEEALWKFIGKTGINVVTPMFTADDLVTHEYPFYLGRQGMPGNKAANYAIDNCDVLLIIGERMQLTQTSYDHEKFAPQAMKIMVDINEGELHKKTLKIDVPIQRDARLFLEDLLREDVVLNLWHVPTDTIDPAQYACKREYLNVYAFLERLNSFSSSMDVATANGMASVVPHQGLRIQRGQRFITNAGLGHMGSGLPLAIGACVGNGKNPTICCEGDGSIMLNIQELQMVGQYRLPLKIFIFNNGGYYSIRSTHQRYFDKVFAADAASGVTLPDFSKLIPAWGLPYVRIRNDSELGKLDRVMQCYGPIVCELIIDPEQPMLERWSAGMFTEK
jgi:acetolactate synthase-1/2/3 large subunit